MDVFATFDDNLAAHRPLIVSTGEWFVVVVCAAFFFIATSELSRLGLDEKAVWI